MSATDLISRNDLFARIAAFGVGGEHEHVRPSDDDWSGATSVLRSQRLTGLAQAAAEAGWLELSESLLRQLLDAHREAMAWALVVERRMLAVADAFAEVGLPFVVLKGPAVAHSVYPDPSWRPFADLDLLVPTHSWRRSLEVAESIGFRRRLPEPRRGFDERFGKAAAHTDADGMELDLHRTLVLGPFGLWVPPGQLIDNSIPFQLGGRLLRRLDDTSLLIHACMHASLGWRPPLLWTLRDVAQVARSGLVDWDEFTVRVERWRLRAVIRHAFEAVASTLGVPIPPEASTITASVPSRSQRRALEAYTTDRRRRGGTATATLRAIPGVRGKAAYLRALLFPERDFLGARSRNGSRPSHLRRWLVAGRWLVRRRGREA